MRTIAHVSDIHFGKITQPGVVDALVDEVNARGVDLVAISGDLTQRARHREFRAAVAMIERFAAPTLVVPGNHDVYPWWHPLHRIFKPLRRYRRYFGDDLTPTFVEQDELAVIGINSAHGKTVKGGRIGAVERASVRAFFTGRPASTFKVLVLHHHLVQIRALGDHDVAHRAAKALETASAVGVDLVLCGHLHVSHIEPLELRPDRHPLVIASAGTATSNRGRAQHRDTNFYNLITVEPQRFAITERRYDPDRQRFEDERATSFERSFE